MVKIDRKLFVMRHAAVQNPADTVYSNLPGFPLSELGREQAREAGQFLSRYHLDVVITSGRERARETAQIVAEANPGNPKVIVDENLRDSGLGTYVAKISFADWNARRKRYWQKQLQGEGGMESPHQIQERVMGTWGRVLRDYPTANILFVSHAGPLAILLESLERRDLRPASEAGYGIGKADVLEIEIGPPFRIRKVFEPTTKI
jgi:broad specificity phosphatase PhoE